MKANPYIGPRPCGRGAGSETKGAYEYRHR